MAITTLTPTIRVCFSDNCSKMKIYDTTGAESVANTGGWGATNVNPVDVTAAVLSYTVPGEDAVELNVLTTVNAQTTVTGEFLLAEVDLTTGDGTHSFVYTLTDGALSVVKYHTIFSLCAARCCIDKLWAKAALNLVEEDCGCTENSSSYASKALLAEAIFKAISNGVSCSNANVRDALLTKLQRICNLENCNCN